MVEGGPARSIDEAGKTLSSAPESMRKCFPDCLSKIEMVDVEDGAVAVAIVDRPCIDRRPRFPKLDVEVVAEPVPASDS